MTYTVNPIYQQLNDIAPFSQLPAEALQRLSEKSQLLRYRMGQPILRRETMPHQVILIKEGQVRLLGYDPYTKNPITLKLLEAGDILGLAGPARGVACESAIASTEIVSIAIPVQAIKQLITNHPDFGKAIQNHCYLAELFEIISKYFEKQAHNVGNIAELTETIKQSGLVVKEVPAGQLKNSDLDSQYLWFISRGNVAFHEQGGQLSPTMASTEVLSRSGARLVGIPSAVIAAQVETKAAEVLTDDPWENGASPVIDIPYAEALPTGTGVEEDLGGETGAGNYPHIRARGEMDSLVACFEMLTKHFGMPFKRDVVRRVLTNQKARLGEVSLASCGAVADMLGLKPQLAKVPASAIGRLPKLALIKWRDSYALLYATSAKQYVLGCPQDKGIVRHSPKAFEEIWGPEGEVLLLETTAQTPQQRFGLSWFVPSLIKYKWILVEVLAASFFYQIFGLANPLMIQVIIDRVIVQQSVDTLHVLGIFLVIMAVFEAILGSLRTYLFVDTTNRIDMTLASQTIDHLLRLPLKYFDRRPVGELSSRVNELENIRQFLTGTALTVVLDAVFSVVYILVMLIYSVKLTVVSLATIPLFLALTLFVSPIVRRQLRAKAEQNAKTQSFLVEALSGIQTVKAQNIELNTRWKWQDRYGRYVSDGFKTVLTSTTASSASNFLNKLSGLLVLWFGAYLVLEGELTLGGLIAFRIISGYVTQPLLRLTQLWQNFQETALSLERLADIVDHPQEQEEEQRSQIPMPDVKGHVRYENVSFRFGASGPLQLSNINAEFPVGQFVGLVGLSGSGKSTMMKLLPRLYAPNSGRILIDNYDINKVELYSLRRQVGIVPQDSLLFEGTIQENISLTNPEATTDEVIEAARIACCHDFIMDMPVGYNSRVGERGSSLSGGQRQRIAIARTILQNPRLLILDEATSALDYDTEAQVSLNLKKWAKNRTVFFITHRLGALRTANTILVMDQGSIVEEGTHEELLALKGRYYCLYQQQGNG